MTQLKKSYQELLSLTQLFLLREYPFCQKRECSFIKKEEKKTPPAPSYSTPSALPPPPLVTAPSSPFSPIIPTPTSPQPLISQEKKQELKEKVTKWELEPLKPSDLSLDIKEFRALFPSLFPHLTLSKSIPPDHEARKIKNLWLNKQETAILILSFGEEETSSIFLNKMAKGISERLASASVLPVSRIKKEEEWQRIFNSPSLRLIIASDYALYTHPQLAPHYKEHPQERKYFLFNKPLLLLSDPSLYLQQPQLKALLWKTIQDQFTSTLSL